MLAIKLSRFGKKKQPFYRVVVMEKSKDPWGNYLENLGTYNPLKATDSTNLKTDRIEYWLSKGAQPTDTVHNMFVEAGIIKDKKRSVSSLGKKIRTKMAEEAKAAKEAEDAKKAEAEAAKAAAEAPKEEPKAE